MGRIPLTKEQYLARATPVPSSTPTRHLRVTIRLAGANFSFDLCHRQLALSPACSIQYYWMDSTGFRITQSRRQLDPANFRACLGHWWAAMKSSGRHRDPNQINHLLLAASYAALSGGKAGHQVFRDAHLAPCMSEPDEQTLSNDVNL